MIWPAAALAGFLLGFVFLYASVLQDRMRGAATHEPTGEAELT
jgi:hypothetical protein